MDNKLHGHFWFDLNKGESHNVDHDSSFHIQHVVRNPKKFGFNNKEEMQQHASFPIKDIESGYRDIDYNLEHHVMGKGFARGYHWAPSNYGNGEINVDVASKEHGVQALKHFLPIIKDSEAKGKSYSVTLTTGHRGEDASEQYFSSSDQIEQHIGKSAPTGLQSKEPRTFQGVGQVGEPLRKKIKDALRKKDPSAPNWKLEQEVGHSTGTWGDSVEYKTYKELFKEMMEKQRTPSASQELRMANQKTTQTKLQRAGGESAIRGTAAAAAGLKPTQLAAIEKGKKLSGTQAQQIVGKLFKK